MVKKMTILLAIAMTAMVTYGAVPVLDRGDNGSAHINQALSDLYDEVETPVVTNVPTSNVQASGTLTMAVVPVTNDTVTIAYGATTNEYTFVETNATAVVDNQVVIGTLVVSQSNLIAIVEADGVVIMGDFNGSDESTVSAVIAGTAGNSIATTASLQVADDFTDATLLGGIDMTVTDANIELSTSWMYVKPSSTVWKKMELLAMSADTPTTTASNYTDAVALATLLTAANYTDTATNGLDIPFTESAPTSLIASAGTLTMVTIPVTNDTVTIASGAITNIYTFVATNATVIIDNEVVIGANVTNSQVNLIAIVEADSVVTMGTFNGSDESTITAVTAGTVGNSIATTSSLQSTDAFTAGTLSGGTDMTVTDADILRATGYIYVKISAIAWRKITLEAL